MIAVTELMVGEKIDVNPNKIVAGAEADKTNIFLQYVFKAATAGVDSTPAVRQVLGLPDEEEGGQDDGAAEEEARRQEEERQAEMERKKEEKRRRKQEEAQRRAQEEEEERQRQEEEERIRQ